MNDDQEEPVKVDKETVDAPQPETVPEARLEERGAGKKLAGHIIITKTQPEGATWYVLHTTSGHEARVSEGLRQRVETMGLTGSVFELLIPTQDRVVIRGGRKLTVKEKIFPGYLLVKMILDDNTWLTIRTTPGITGFVGAGAKPTALSNDEVANIEKFISSPAPRFKARFSVGEAVKITDGPFADFLGSISEIDDEKGRVKVLVNIFDRETPVELDFLQISKA